MQSTKEIIVAEACWIEDRGTAVFFVEDPQPWWSRKAHLVQITTPDGSCSQAMAFVEFARRVPPGEVMVLLFPDKVPGDLIQGTRIISLG